MIVTRLEADGLAQLPSEVVDALGLVAGDEIRFEIGLDGVIMMRADERDMFVADYSTFTEWATEADCRAFDNL